MTGTLLQREVVTRRKLMLVVTSLSLAGGAEVQAIEMAVGLKRRGWDIEIVTLLTPEPPSPDLSGTGVTVRDLAMRRGFADPGALLRFRAMVRESRPDVVHSHMTHANLLARAARPFAEMPALICTLHGYKMYSVKSNSSCLRELAHRVTDRFADLTTVVCQAAADRYAQVRVAPPEKMLVVPNGIRTALYRPDAGVREQVRRSLQLRSEFVWLAAGRLEMVKDYDTMLRAFAMALEAGDTQTLLIAGEGSLRPALERTSRDLGIAPNVRFLGFRPDLANLMRAADGFLMSSMFEGLPLVLLEAGASELPVAATRVGGNPEAMQEGRSGFLAPERNPKALSEAMLRIAGLSEVERRSMGRCGADFVRAKYSLDTVLDQWEALYQKLTGKEQSSLARVV